MFECKLCLIWYDFEAALRADSVPLLMEVLKTPPYDFVYHQFFDSVKAEPLCDYNPLWNLVIWTRKTKSWNILSELINSPGYIKHAIDELTTDIPVEAFDHLHSNNVFDRLILRIPDFINKFIMSLVVARKIEKIDAFVRITRLPIKMDGTQLNRCHYSFIDFRGLTVQVPIDFNHPVIRILHHLSPDCSNDVVAFLERFHIYRAFYEIPERSEPL